MLYIVRSELVIRVAIRVVVIPVVYDSPDSDDPITSGEVTAVFAFLPRVPKLGREKPWLILPLPPVPGHYVRLVTLMSPPPPQSRDPIRRLKLPNIVVAVPCK